MRGPHPTPITLSSDQSQELERIIRKATSEQRIVQRAQIILLCSEGYNNQQIANHLSINRDKVRTWRERWLSESDRIETVETQADEKTLAEFIQSVLTDDPRPGRPPSFSEKQIVDIVALACEDPSSSGRPISHWTPREVAEEAEKRKIVKKISTRSVGRFLKRS